MFLTCLFSFFLSYFLVIEKSYYSNACIVRIKDAIVEAKDMKLFPSHQQSSPDSTEYDCGNKN